MIKKIILVLVILVSLSWLKTAYANVLINEVQISPAGERFIELFNSGNSVVDLTGWYLQRKTETGNDFGSLVSKTNFENKKIEAGDYFLISRGMVNSDIVLGSLTLTESNAIQLKNSEGNVVSKVGWGNSTECEGVCLPNPKEGKSIQRQTSGSLIEGSPTPRSLNLDSSLSIDSSNGDEDNTFFNETDVQAKNKTGNKPSMKTEIIATTLAFVGQPTSFQANVFGYSNEKIVLGKLFWNFGDGVFQEQVNKFERFSHIYMYPGEYIVTLSYYSNVFNKEPEVFNKIIIKVIPLSVSISKIGIDKDFFVELSNNSDYETDISGWVLRASQKNFIFPEGSIILPKQKMMISGGVTGFSINDNTTLGLFSSTGVLVFDYYQSLNNKVRPIQRISLQEQKSKNKLDSLAVNQIGNNFREINSDLTANTFLLNEKNQNNSYAFFWGFIILLIVSGSMVYLIRQRKNRLENIEEFDIIDE